MDYDEHRQKVKEFLQKTDAPKFSRDLSELCYACSELGLLPIDGSIDVESALEIWKIVETARVRGFPKNLWM